MLIGRALDLGYLLLRRLFCDGLEIPGLQRSLGYVCGVTSMAEIMEFR